MATVTLRCQASVPHALRWRRWKERRRYIFAWATALAFATSLAVPVHAAEDSEYAVVVENAVSGYIVPAFSDLLDATGELGPAMSDLCLFPWSDERSFVAGAFASTVTAWAAVDFLRFGPMMEDGRYERFAFFPDVHGTGARQLRRFLADENPALLEAGALAEQSAAVQGLPALESLLYSGSKALLKTEEPEPYRCQLALRVAGNMRTIAQEALLRWTEPGGWAELLKTPGARNSVYRTDTEAMTEVLKAILTGLEQLRDHRLLPALGDTPDEAKASRAPYNASALALPYIAASVDALERFVGVSGILGLVPEENKWIVGSAAFEFGNLKRALGEAGPDLEAALADPARREKLVYAAIVLASLRDLFQNRLGPAAGISGGFNSLDGD
jgi:uncharacterized protein